MFSVVAGSRAKEGLLDLLFRQRENYEKELEIVKNVNNEKDKKKAEALENHKEGLEELEEQHNVELEKLQEEKQEELANTIKDGNAQPERLAKKIAKILNVEYFKKNR